MNESDLRVTILTNKIYILNIWSLLCSVPVAYSRFLRILVTAAQQMLGTQLCAQPVGQSAALHLHSRLNNDQTLEMNTALRVYLCTETTILELIVAFLSSLTGIYHTCCLCMCRLLLLRHSDCSVRWMNEQMDSEAFQSINQSIKSASNGLRAAIVTTRTLFNECNSVFETIRHQ